MHQATVVHIPGLDRREGEEEEEEEKEAKTVAAQTAGSSSLAARRRTRTHTHVHTNTHNSSFLDEATPKTEGWFMRRSRPMGIRACWGIQLHEGKKKKSRF